MVEKRGLAFMDRRGSLHTVGGVSADVSPLTEVAEAASAREREAVVPPALRADLRVSHQLFEGRAFVIIKDPLSLKYFRLPAEDHALALLLDGRRSLGRIAEVFVQQQPQAGLVEDREALLRRVERFAAELQMGGFLEATAGAVRQQMRAEEARRRPASPWGLFMKLLFLQVPLFDPDRLLTRLERRMRWVWTWTGLVLSVLVFLAGLGVFLLNWPRIEPSLSGFFTLPNLALVWVLTLGVKVVHEFGHGLTCKHYGGEVHEMGAMLMVFSPFLYADVTDSYLFASKRQRILVSAAGIWIELVIAALATLLWAVAQPGPTQQLLFNLMLITSVWTVLFNANPLMKFDGYYILMDLLDVPNLRAKAQRCTRELFRRFWFGRDGGLKAATEALPRRRGWFVIYSLAAQLYLLQITLGLAVLFHRGLQPYGLSWLGDLLGVGAVISMVVAPVAGFFHQQLSAAPLRSPAGRRAWGMLAGVLVLTTLLLLMPWPVRIERPAVLQPEHSAWVRVLVAGRLERMHVSTGQVVRAGEVIATLSNGEIAASLKQAELRVERARREVDLALGLAEPAAHRQAQVNLAQAKSHLAELQEKAERLILKAPLAGVVVTPDLGRLAAASFRPGDAVCEVAAPDSIQIYMPLDEHQVRHIRPGQKVELRVPAVPDVTFEGTVMEDAKTPPQRELPPNLVATLGGDLAAQPDAQGRLEPLQTTFGVRVALPNPGKLLRPGMTGTARLHGEVRPLGGLLWMKVLDFISLDYRL